VHRLRPRIPQEPAPADPYTIEPEKPVPAEVPVDLNIPDIVQESPSNPSPDDYAAYPDAPMAEPIWPLESPVIEKQSEPLPPLLKYPPEFSIHLSHPFKQDEETGSYHPCE
jgi:hypothetical protein